MHYSKIEAAAVPSLFDVHHENASLCGKSGKTGPRAAVAQEIRAYAAWLASKAGLYPFNASEVIGGGIAWRSRHNEPVMGVTYGEQRGRNAETREYEYEPGSYSIPFPGRNAHRDKVTFETLDDDGNVIASSCLPVEPKKGGVIWDRDAVRKAAGKVAKPSRGKVAAPLSAEIDDKAENPVAEAQEPVAVADDASEAVALLSGPEIAPVEPVSNRDELPTSGLADQVAALAAMVEEMRSQLAALSTGKPEVTTPIEEMTSAPPVSGKRERTAAHERAIMAYLRARSSRNTWKRLAHDAADSGKRNVELMREKYANAEARAAGNARAREKCNQLEAELSIARGDLAQTHKDAVRFAALAKAEGVKRRRAVLFARDLQKRLNAEHRLVDRLTTAKREVVQDLMDARAEIATLKAKPHHMGQEIKPDDYQRLMRERDEARASLASDREKLRIMRTSLERSADALDMITERAFRAENALRAVEQRQARAGTPYRANVRAVTFGQAA